MEELIVEGLNYEDFVALKKILEKNTIFHPTETEDFGNALTLIEKINEILKIFDE